VTVELQKGIHGRVLASQTLHTSERITRFQNGTVPPIRVVKGLLSLP
jgi:hypothetical protein